jgi:hypothetical protein
MLIPFGVLSAAAFAPSVAGDYELIESAILTSNESSVTFSNLGTYASTYKHLQIRMVGRTTIAETGSAVFFRFNSDTSTSYAAHDLFGTGSSVLSTGSSSLTLTASNFIAGGNAASNNFGAGIVDILDPYSTTKNKTVRGLSGVANSSGPIIILNSGLYYKTDSITSITLFPPSGNLVSGSRFSIYGIKG